MPRRIKDSITGISTNAISTLIHDANTSKKFTLRLSSLVYEEIRAKLVFHLRDTMRIVVIFTEESKNRTIMKKHVYPALDYTPTIIRKKMCNKRSGDDTDCFYFPKESFRNVIREITDKLDVDLRFSTEALVLLQMNAEHYLTLLAKNAIGIMHNDSTERHTLFPKDIQSANRQLCKKKLVGTMSKPVSFDGCIKKALTQFSSKKVYSIQPDADEQLSFMLNAVAQAIVKVADEMCRINKRKTLSARSILYATRIVLTGELAKHAFNEGETGETNVDKLLFSVSVTEMLIRSSTCLSVMKESCLALTAVLEYLTYELLDLSISATASSNVITSKHLVRAIQNDEELSDLMSDLNIYY